MTRAELARLAQLTPETRLRAERVIDHLRARGYNCFIGQTRRDAAQVAATVKAGRSSATLKHSWHELGRAVDLRLRIANGIVSYDTSPASEPFYRALQEEAEREGMRCLAYRKNGEKLWLKTKKGRIWDPGHIEYRAPYQSIEEAYAAEGQKVG